MYSSTTLIGRLGRDPEVRYTPQGTPVCNFSMATDHSYKKDDEWQKKTEWHKIVAFGPKAESAGKYLKKGSKVMVEGRLEESKWESDGQKHNKWEIIANTIKFLDKKGSQGGASQETYDGNVPDEQTELEPF